MNEPDLCFSWRSHIKTFDGRYIYFPGRCTYKLIHDCADNLFSVHVFGDPLCKNLTRCRRSVNLYLGGVDIKVSLVLNFTGSLWGKLTLAIISINVMVSLESGVSRPVMRKIPSDLFRRTWPSYSGRQERFSSSHREQCCHRKSVQLCSYVRLQWDNGIMGWYRCGLRACLSQSQE